MEDEFTKDRNNSFILEQLVPTFLPVLLIAVSYVDPGKWVAAVEGGAQFGTDLVFLVIIFNLATILWQYLAAHISVVTGRNLMQICADEYDRLTCIFLGVQSELSAIALELSMIFGVAHGINAVFGFGLTMSVILAAPSGFLHLLFSSFLANSMMKCLYMSMAGIILLLYFMGILSSQQEMSFSLNGLPAKLSSESTFAVMCLLGASAMPQNFYGHSFVLQQCKVSPNLSKGALFHDHFFAILTLFSGISLASYLLMNSAANIFYNGELTLHTFQDTLFIIDQVFRNSTAHFILLALLLVSTQITSTLQNAVMCSMWSDYLKIDLPCWLHHLLIRGLAFFTAFYCVRNSGAEGVYRLLIFTQVLVSLLLPSSVVPLFRVASSGDVMGVYKISSLVEFFALVLFIGMLGLKLVFVLEMIFGDNDWVRDLMWNFGNSMIAPYLILLIVACSSFSLTLWLAVTPLRCTRVRMDLQAHTWDFQSTASNSVVEEVEELVPYSELCQEKESFSELTETLESVPYTHVPTLDFDLPETILEEPYLSTIEENPTGAHLSDCELHDGNESVYTEPSDTSVLVQSAFTSGFSDSSSPNTSTVIDGEDKAVEFEKDSQLTTETDLRQDTFGFSETSTGTSPSGPPLASEGSGSLRSLNGKSDEGGNGPVSLSRLSGLGRAARRQMTVILDEFWGQLFDFHGNTSKEGKEKRIDMLLGVGIGATTRATPSEVSNTFSQAGRESAHFMRYDPYDSPRQQRAPQGMMTDSSYGIQHGSQPLWSSRMGLLDAYVQNSTTLYPNERRYSSLRVPSSSPGWDYQPATIHGYQMASYINRLAKERAPDYLHSQVDSPPQSKPTFLSPPTYRDSLSSVSGPPGFPKVTTPLISSQQSERPYYATTTVDGVGSPQGSKKYHSLPDISGVSVVPRTQCRQPIGFGSSVSDTLFGQSVYPAGVSSTSMAFDNIYPSRVYPNSSSITIGPTMDPQGFRSRNQQECFGVAKSSYGPVDSEAIILQLFRCCMVKLLKLEGSDWLFSQNSGIDEDLIDSVAARERFISEAENRDMKQADLTGEVLFQHSSERMTSAVENGEIMFSDYMVSSVPHCGEGCVWRADLIVSFGVWCMHRVLDLSLMESRPELWGKYTYVLNRLQGIIELAFSKPRFQRPLCLCLQLPKDRPWRPAASSVNGISAVKKGKWTTAASVMEMVKEVEGAISGRKGRQGTAAGDVAFPKGKENLASVLKRYKRRLSKLGVISSH